MDLESKDCCASVQTIRFCFLEFICGDLFSILFTSILKAQEDLLTLS